MNKAIKFLEASSTFDDQLVETVSITEALHALKLAKIDLIEDLLCNAYIKTSPAVINVLELKLTTLAKTK